jgi:hypothetical protein
VLDVGWIFFTTKAVRGWPGEVFDEWSTGQHALLTPEATIEAESTLRGASLRRGLGRALPRASKSAFRQSSTRFARLPRRTCCGQRSHGGFMVGVPSRLCPRRCRSGHPRSSWTFFLTISSAYARECG